MTRSKRLFPKLAIVAIGCVVLALAMASSASAKFEFSKVSLALSNPDGHYESGTHPDLIAGGFLRQAGAHPDLIFDFETPTVFREGIEGAAEYIHDASLELPLGMVGNPTAYPTCSVIQMVNNSQGFSGCPLESGIGLAAITYQLNGQPTTKSVGIFNMEHGTAVPGLFAFKFENIMIFITPGVKPGDYAISSGSVNTSQGANIRHVTLKFWGVPSDPVHDTERATADSPLAGATAFPDPAPRRPFLTNPTSCSDSASPFTARADSWEFPGLFDERTLANDPDSVPFAFEGCEQLPFDPSLETLPGTHRAHSPTGLDVDLTMPSNEGPDGLAAAHVKKTVLTFPQGMTVSPSAVAGLQSCSLAQIKLGSNEAPSCPDGSKLGNAEIKTQLLKETLEGDVFLAAQNENPFGSLFAIYLVVKGPGFYLKLPGELNVNKQTGQMKTIFDNLPQQPFESVHLDFRGGPTAPLTTPNVCGNYQIQTEVFSWATNTPRTFDTPMPINEDCVGGGSFNPQLQAGVANPVAGAESPLTLRVRRLDGEQNLSQLEFKLPEGELAKLKGVELCPESLAPSGKCGPKSQVGISTTAIGTGAFPLFVPQPGKAPTALYLAGPYKGAPYSLITMVPAQSGPFDFGTIVVRTAINVDPVTTQVIAKSDPLPQILEGVPISYRDVRIEVQKPDFTVNPTSCEQRAVTSTITSTTGAVSHPSVPAKVGDCASLNFGPKLAFKLKGGTNRGDFQALTATLTTGKKEANIAKVAVTLPHSEFLAQEHIGTVCTRVQFAAKNCPAASIYGFAKATTPLLATPLEGPVYLRSSNNPLPDMVAALNGQFNVELAGRIDSVNGGIRNRFEVVPDAPVSKFELKLKGGDRSLLVNSRNLCKAPSRADVKMVGQNGMRSNSRPLVVNSCGKKAKKKTRAKQRRS
jgi:hypothetical protein